MIIDILGMFFQNFQKKFGENKKDAFLTVLSENLLLLIELKIRCLW